MNRNSAVSTTMTDNTDTAVAGLFEQNHFKKSRNALFFLYTYLDSINANFYPLHTVISILRIIQFVGPSLAAPYKNFWDRNTSTNSAISIISIAFHIVPPQYRAMSSIAMEIIFVAIIILVIIILIISSIMFRKNSKVYSFVPPFIIIFVNGILHLFPPIMMQFIGETIGNIIMASNYYGIAAEASLIVLTLIFVFAFYIFLWHISSVSLAFRPFSLMTITRQPQCYFSFLVAIITFISAIASKLENIGCYILTYFCALLYLLAIPIIFMEGSFVANLHKHLIFASSIVSSITMIFVATCLIVGRTAVIVELFVIILLFLIFYFVSLLIQKRHTLYILRFLDENGEEIEKFKSVHQFLVYAVVGVINSHHSCANWRLLKEGAQRWPDNINLLIIFGKFVAIYPDECPLLSYIVQSLQVNKFGVFIGRQTIAQAQNIMTQREDSLSIELKQRLSKSSRQVQFARRKIRHVWDLAIQSNIIEMNSSISAAFISVNKAKSNFNQLFRQYPNNRFVARAYARFAYDIEGDLQLYAEWCEKIRNLQRGILVNPDKTNLLGMHAFPMLPTITQCMMTRVATESEIPMDGGFSEADDQETQLNEQTSVIQDKIKNLSIPAINFIIIWMTVLYFLFILIPAIGVLCYVNIFLAELTFPLDYIYHISYLRSAAFQIPMLVNHWIGENIPKPNNPSESLFPVPKHIEDLSSYGNANTTFAQVKFIITKASYSVEVVGKYRNWLPSGKNIDLVHKIVFEEFIEYRYFRSTDNNATITNVSLQTAMMDEIMQVSDLMNVKNINASLFTTSNVVNPSVNANSIVNATSYALSILNEYHLQKHKDTQNVMYFFMMFLCMIYVVTILGLLVFQIENLRSAKYEVYQCLTSLPKNVVSYIAESMGLLHKGLTGNTTSEDVDLNKQDENIIKVFSSASDVTFGKSSERTTYVAFNFLIMFCVVIIIVLICQVFPKVTNTLEQNAPHLDNILGSVSYMFGTINAVNVLVLMLNGYPLPVHDFDSAANKSLERHNLFLSYYHKVRYGGEGSDNTPPFHGFQDARKIADKFFSCPNETHVQTEFEGHFDCLSLDLQIYLLGPFISKLVLPYDEKIVTFIDSQDPIINSVWEITAHLYDQFFFPMFDGIVVGMRTILGSEIPNLRTPTIALLCFSFVIVLLVFVEAHKSSEKIKFALSLLLQCPPNIVMQTSKVMDILSGDFGSKSHEGFLRHKDFFDSIVESIPDSVMVINEQGEIESMNRSSERIYGIKRNEYIRKNAKDFFGSKKFSRNILDQINSSERTIEVVYKNEDYSSYFELSYMTSKSSIVIIARDQTTQYSYEKLISDEKEKNDRLLSSILPPNLIGRVKNGEQNISFSVRSATILFLDIVEFTPWCASNTANMIMSTLNIMFREFDSRLLQHSTMTKIKCIGDCYMAAGGIFVEVNQPAVHAKEVVDFGLEVIYAVISINSEYNLNLKIRVGVNTGGPIVAGVIGTDKPTFEILGPPINMAQQMEHHGIPMLVHISRAVYQLIYGGSFNIKERGKIEIKNGSISTYLVIPEGRSA